MTASVLAGRDAAAAANALLQRLERDAGVPLVDEAEHHRLVQSGRGEPVDLDHWHAVLARRADEVLEGYAGLVVQSGQRAVADVVVDRATGCGDGLQAVFTALQVLASRHAVRQAQAWVRHAAGDDLDCAARAGWRLDRRLDVLARDVSADDPGSPPLPDGLQVRSWTDAADDALVAEVLAAAYAGSPDDGWTAELVAARRRMPWFRAADLLLAVDGDGPVAVHWTKRRGPDEGEVYNLAVHPRGRGRGLGALLLDVGLHHLAQAGARRVLLWVDRANEPAQGLYRSRGFGRAWTDLAVSWSAS